MSNIDYDNVSVCSVCRKKIRETNVNKVKCISCKHWIHSKCVNRTDTEDYLCVPCSFDCFPFQRITDDHDYLCAINSDDKQKCDLNMLKFKDFKSLGTVCPDLFGQNVALYDDDVEGSNHYNNLVQSSCDYVDTNDLNHKLLANSDGVIDSFLHINARSLIKNADSIAIELDQLNNKFSIIGISETWTKSESDNIKFQGYTSVIKSRKHDRGGGVGLFVRKDLNLSHSIRSDLDLNDQSVGETLFLEIKNKIMNNSKSVIVGKTSLYFRGL